VVRKEVIFMATATMTSKGQVTLPKNIRERLGLKKGAVVEFQLDDAAGTATIRPLERKAQDLFGLLSSRAPARPVSDLEIREAVKKALKRKAG
jgi:AbrB family looped-hinge helix DNA binding protein